MQGAGLDLHPSVSLTRAVSPGQGLRQTSQSWCCILGADSCSTAMGSPGEHFAGPFSVGPSSTTKHSPWLAGQMSPREPVCKRAGSVRALACLAHCGHFSRLWAEALTPGQRWNVPASELLALAVSWTFGGLSPSFKACSPYVTNTRVAPRWRSSWVESLGPSTDLWHVQLDRTAFPGDLNGCCSGTVTCAEKVEAFRTVQMARTQGSPSICWNPTLRDSEASAVSVLSPSSGHRAPDRTRWSVGEAEGLTPLLGFPNELLPCLGPYLM